MGRRQKTNNIVGWLFISPSILVFFIFIFLPMGVAFFVSLQKWNMLGAMKFVGFKNYNTMLGDEYFWNALKISLLYVAGTVPTTVILAVLIAILLNQKIYGLSFFRIMIYLPVITSMAAAAVVFMYLFDNEYGFINYVLATIGLPKLKWLNDRAQALIALIIVGIWKRVGYNTVILLAGLQSIPSSYYEAAKIDGANIIAMTKNITIPLLSPVTFFVTVIQVIASLKVFTSIMVMTEGGPARGTEAVPFYLYKNAFVYHKMGYASALAYILFAIIFIFTLVQFRFGEKRVHY